MAKTKKCNKENAMLDILLFIVNGCNFPISPKEVNIDTIKNTIMYIPRSNKP